MRIAYLCADRGVPVSGTKGAAVHVRAVAQALVDKGHEIDIVSVREAEPVPGFDPRIHVVPFERTLKDLRRSIDGDGRSTLSSEVYSLLLNSLCHDALVELERRGPVDAVYERYSLWSTAGVRYARRRGIPWVLEVNAPLVDEQRTYRELKLGEVAEGIERFAFAQADAIFVPSAELREYVRDRVGPRKRVLVLPNGAPVERFSRPQPLPDRDLRQLEGRFVVTFVGSLKPWHGVAQLLRAYERLLAEVPEAHLLVIGDGPMRPQLEKAARRLGPERVTVVGEVAHDEIPAWLRLADVGVAPYPQLERFYFSPLKVVEYMAAGLPVVASSLGQLRELVRDGVTGLLVPPGNETALAAALGRLAADPKLRRRMGAKARRRARDRHGWSSIAQRVERALLELRRKREPGRRAGASLASAGGLS